jgi:hypothetical protein
MASSAVGSVHLRLVALCYDCFGVKGEQAHSSVAMMPAIAAGPCIPLAVAVEPSHIV